MRVDLSKIYDLTKSEKTKYLLENKEELISQKKSVPITSDVFIYLPSRVKSGTADKANDPVNEDVDQLRVKVVANSANWIDSHMDMLLPDCWSKSINERKNIIPHLHDHIHQLGAKLGKVVDIFSSQISLSELGLNQSGSTQALIFITDIIKSYNEKIFNQYKNGEVNQHSIGLQYVKLDLAINDEDSEKEYDFWNKYYEQVINKELADLRGFFWVIQEIKLLENSAVLFGANVLTPTLDNNVKGEPLDKALEKEDKTEPDDPTLKDDKEGEEKEINYLINFI